MVEGVSTGALCFYFPILSALWVSCEETVQQSYVHDSIIRFCFKLSSLLGASVLALFTPVDFQVTWKCLCEVFGKQVGVDSFSLKLLNNRVSPEKSV
jgi:hypothetical protein